MYYKEERNLALRDILDFHSIMTFAGRIGYFRHDPQGHKIWRVPPNFSQHLTIPPALNLSFSLLLKSLSYEFHKRKTRKDGSDVQIVVSFYV